MANNYANYSQYLGARKCCYLKGQPTSGGVQGQNGINGLDGLDGATGPTGIGYFQNTTIYAPYGITGTTAAFTYLSAADSTGIVISGVTTLKNNIIPFNAGIDTNQPHDGNNDVSNVSMTNIVSNTGVVSTDTTGVGTGRYALAAAGYGSDKALFGYGNNGGDVSMTNKVSNTGVVSTDTTGVGTERPYLAAAGFSAGTSPAPSKMNWRKVFADAAVLFGTQKAIFGYGDNDGSLSMTNLVSNTGVVATDTTGVGMARKALAAAGYGSDKELFGYGYTNYSITNLVSNTGVVSTDTTGVGTGRGYLAAAGYGTDKAIFGYGYNDGSGLSVSMTNLVSNTGVVATDTTGR